MTDAPIGENLYYNLGSVISDMNQYLVQSQYFFLHASQFVYFIPANERSQLGNELYQRFICLCKANRAAKEKKKQHNNNKLLNKRSIIQILAP